jgi:hypothetical protein
MKSLELKRTPSDKELDQILKCAYKYSGYATYISLIKRNMIEDTIRDKKMYCLKCKIS